MIDISVETVPTFTEAAAKLPRRRHGKKPHIATLYRWAERGLKGIRLETIQVGGTCCTSLEALQRFFERLTKPRSEAPPPPHFNRARLRQIEQAERECAEAGF
ncbi:MAG TPA: DUF1580 domain-containing protein [Phycisphaerae bacterium]|nr:DUF1580 domain-containing protein [Phycisphaerae bacterium]